MDENESDQKSEIQQIVETSDHQEEVEPDYTEPTVQE